MHCFGPWLMPITTSVKLHFRVDGLINFLKREVLLFLALTPKFDVP